MPKDPSERHPRTPAFSLERLLGAARGAWKAQREQNERDWERLAAEQARVPTLD
jgi:cell division protein FtsL